MNDFRKLLIKALQLIGEQADDLAYVSDCSICSATRCKRCTNHSGYEHRLQEKHIELIEEVIANTSITTGDINGEYDE